MRKVKCHDCGKHYDYDVDDFCPKCGAFTLPARKSRIGADGSVIWQDGINEKGHRNSFVHSEYHAENRKRSHSRLEGKLPKPDLSGVALKRPIAPRGKKGSASQAGQIVIVIAFLILYFLVRTIF